MFFDNAACEYGAANTSPSIVLRQPESALIRALSKVSALKGEVRAAFLEASGVISKHYLDGSHDAYIEKLKELGEQVEAHVTHHLATGEPKPKIPKLGRAIAAFLRTRLFTVANRLRRATETRGEAVAGRPAGYDQVRAHLASGALHQALPIKFPMKRLVVPRRRTQLQRRWAVHGSASWARSYRAPRLRRSTREGRRFALPFHPSRAGGLSRPRRCSRAAARREEIAQRQRKATPAAPRTIPH